MDGETIYRMTEMPTGAPRAPPMRLTEDLVHAAKALEIQNQCQKVDVRYLKAEIEGGVRKSKARRGNRATGEAGPRGQATVGGHGTNTPLHGASNAEMADQPNSTVGMVRKLTLAWSDGRTEVELVTENGQTVRVRNRPTDQQLTPTVDANGQQDYYRELPLSHEMSLMWRAQLAESVAQMMKPGQVFEHPHILTDFPKNYVLYEHVIKYEDELTDIDVSEVTGVDEEKIGGHNVADGKVGEANSGGVKNEGSKAAEGLAEPAEGQQSSKADSSSGETSADSSNDESDDEESGEDDEDDDQGSSDEDDNEEGNKRLTLPAQNDPKEQRRDYFLYGHPGGPQNRYSSPNEFLPHLFWLANPPIKDGRVDPNDCACIMCCPEDIEEVIAEEGTAEAMAAYKAEQAEIERKFKEEFPEEAEAMANQGETDEDEEETSSDDIDMVVAANVPMPMPVSVVVPTMTPVLLSAEQRADANSNLFTYRIGEVIWFTRSPGLVWIGTIINRQMQPDQVTGQYKPRYLIQPLSYQGAKEEVRIIDNEDQIRPWLGYEAHPIQHQALVGKAFHEINWEEVKAGRFGKGDMAVDGSVIGAFTVEKTYTVFQQKQAPHPGRSEDQGKTFWNGIFVGAEKFWVGDPVRLLNAANPGRDVMVVHAIVEYPETDAFKPGATRMAIQLRGDVYNMTSEQYNPETPLPEIHPALPPRMAAELHERNAVVMATGQVFNWTLVRPQATIELGEVNGRWYLSRIAILYRLQQAQIATNDKIAGIKFAIQTMPAGGTVAAGLNNRQLAGKPNNEGGSGEKKVTREEAIGGAVSAGTWFRKGYDGPETDMVFPDQFGSV